MNTKIYIKNPFGKNYETTLPKYLDVSLKCTDLIDFNHSYFLRALEKNPKTIKDMKFLYGDEFK